jgi:hypothetical protein
MEIKAKRGDLLATLYWTQSIVERRNTMPILANVLIEALEPLEFCRRSFEARVPRFQTMRTGDRSVDRQFERVEYAVYPFASAGETRRSDNV